jgi:hypothetical protein
MKGVTLSSLGKRIPPAIEKIFNYGRTYIPFTHLTDKAVSQAMLYTEESTAAVTARMLSREGEEDMLIGPWLQAQSRASILIDRLTPWDTPSFDQHFTWVIDHGNGDDWKRILLYNIMVRYECTVSVLDPGDPPHQDILERATQRYNLEVSLAGAQSRMTEMFTSWVSQQSNVGPQRTIPSLALARSSAVTQQHLPAPVAPVKSTRTPALCFRCGRRRIHHTDKCTETHTYKGATPIVFGRVQSPQAPNTDASGQIWCFRFNGKDGCKFGDTCSWKHMCTICADPSHRTIVCPSIKPKLV